MSAPTAPRARTHVPGPRPANTRLVASRRPHRSVNAHLIREVIAGREPAERLTGRAREDLMCAWLDAGWTDLEIAAHTRWSLYTVGRIRHRLGLTANPDPDRSPT